LREQIKFKHGVTYSEKQSVGASVKIGGESFYKSPEKSGMHIIEFRQKQQQELIERQS
jgi:hypothetical protein